MYIFSVALILEFSIVLKFYNIIIQSCSLLVLPKISNVIKKFTQIPF